MLETWKQKGLQIKLKRAFGIFFVISIAFGIITIGVMFGKFWDSLSAT